MMLAKLCRVRGKGQNNAEHARLGLEDGQKVSRLQAPVLLVSLSKQKHLRSRTHSPHSRCWRETTTHPMQDHYSRCYQRHMHTLACRTILSIVQCLAFAFSVTVSG